MRDLAVMSSRAAYADRSVDYEWISHGSGAYLFDQSGHRYFDASGGSGSLILGHGDTRIASTLAEQASKLTVFPSRHRGCEVVETYAARLTEFAPPGIRRSIVFSSGSDAVEASIKLALHYQYSRGKPGKLKIIGRQASYHGNTLSGLAAGGFVRRRKPYEALLSKTAKPAPAHCAGCAYGLSPNTCAVECADSVKKAILAEDAGTVAAVILEPVVGAALSAAVPDPRYLARVREICDDHDILLIADEVMTGFGRTGANFGVEHWGVEPDIIIAGKAMSAGYFPISALLVGHRVCDHLERNGEPFQNGQTHACSPLASAVGLQVLDRISQDNLVANAKQRGQQLLDSLRAKLASPWIGNIRGLGLMIGVDLIQSSSLAVELPFGLADLVQRLAMARGLILYASSGSAESEAGEHFMLLPPLNIDEQQIEFITQALVETVTDLEHLACPAKQLQSAL